MSGEKGEELDHEKGPLHHVTRKDVYPQRLYGDAWSRVEGTWEEDTRRWTAAELIVYLVVAAYMTWYTLARVEVNSVFHVNQSIEASFDMQPGDFFARREEPLAWEELRTHENVADWLTYYFPRVILPSMQSFSIPLGAVRLTNRLAALTTNPAKGMAGVAPRVWSTDLAFDPLQELSENEFMKPYGAIREGVAPYRSIDVAFHQEFDGQVCNETGLQRLTVHDFVDSEFTTDEMRDTCVEKCGGYRGINQLAVCRCATFRGTRCILYAATAPMQEGAEGYLLPPLAAMGGANALVPKMRLFRHEGFNSTKPKSADCAYDGFRCTPGFVHFVRLSDPSVKDPTALQWMVKDQLQELFSGGFMPRESAALTVDVAAYHINYKMFTWVKIGFQFRPEGPVVKTKSSLTLPVESVVSGTPLMFSFDLWDLSFIGSVGAWLLYEVVIKLRTKMLKQKLWLVLDVLFIIATTATVFLIRESKLAPDGTALLIPNAQLDLATAADPATLPTFLRAFEARTWLYRWLVRASALMLLLAWVRVLKYLSEASAQVGVLFDTLRRASTPIFFFMFLIVLILMGFVAWGNVLFGRDVEEFSTFLSSVSTCIEWAFGQIGVVDDILEKDFVAGCVFFLPFMMIFYFVLVNMTNAILNEAYGSANVAYVSLISNDSGGRPSRMTKFLREIPVVGCFWRPKKTRRRSQQHAKEGKSEPTWYILLYLTFGLSYLVLMTQLCHITESYDMHESVTEELYGVMYTSESGRAVGFADLRTVGDVRGWVSQALPATLYKKQGVVRDPDDKNNLYRYDGRKSYPQLVLRDWSVFVGQNPVRLILRMYSNSTPPASNSSNFSVFEQYPSIRSVYSPPVAELSPEYGYFDEAYNDQDLPFEAYLDANVASPQNREWLKAQWNNGTDPRCFLAEQYGSVLDPAAALNAAVRPTKDARIWRESCKNTPWLCGYRQGVICQVPADEAKGTAFFSSIREESLLTQQAATLVVDFVLFNANVDLFTYVALEFTFPPSGVITKKLYTQSMRLDPYDNLIGTVRRILMYVYMAFVAFFFFYDVKKLVGEMVAMRKEQRENANGKEEGQSAVRRCGHLVSTCLVRHFTEDLYNILDLVSYSFSLLTILAWQLYMNHGLVNSFFFIEEPVWDSSKCQSSSASERGWCNDDDVLTQFMNLCSVFRIFVRFGSVNSLVIWVRLLKFFRTNHHMQIVLGSLVEGLVRILWFFVMLAIILFGFMCMGMLLFGGQVAGFEALAPAFRTCFQMICGNFNFQELRRAESIAPAFFYPFMVIFNWVLMNIFLAIIDKSFKNCEKARRGMQRKRRGPSKLKVVVNALRNFVSRKRGIKRKRTRSGSGDLSLSDEDATEARPESPIARRSGNKLGMGSDFPVTDERVRDEKWQELSDDIRGWSLEVAGRLYDDVRSWEASREASRDSDDPETFTKWFDETLEAELRQKVAQLEYVAKDEQAQHESIIREMSEVISEQKDILIHIRVTQEKLEATKLYRESADKAFAEMHESAHALIFGQRDDENVTL